MANSLSDKLLRKFHDYFTKSILFILGLIFSHKLLEKTFLNILLMHLCRAWEEYDLRRAAVVVNLQEGISALLVTFFAYAADFYTGRYKMVVFSTGVCTVGLLLNYLAARNNEQLDFGLFYPALGLMTLGQAGQTATLQVFLDDQLRPRNTATADNTAWRLQSKFWWIFVSFVAAIFAQFGPLPRFPLRILAVVLTAVMGASFLLFLLGTKSYHRDETIENPFKDVGIVIRRAIANRKVEYRQTQEEPFNNPSGEISWLRWLDKAAIVQEIEAGTGSPSSVEVEQVKRVLKLMLKMIPLWSCFITLSLVAACGSTFFFEVEMSINGDDPTPILLLVNLMRFTEFVVSETSRYALGKLEEREKCKQQKMLVRIGIGMSCCVAAWASAARRQRERRNMSVYWLVPQYLLLGLMGGLSQDGLQSLYESQVSEIRCSPQVSESFSRFGPPFVKVMMGVGKFMSIVCVLIFSTGQLKWFEKKLEHSRLDKYYILLAVLNFGNVIIYCLVGCWYGSGAARVENRVDEETGVADHHQLVDSHLASPRISHRTVSNKSESSSGDGTTESSSSSSRQEAETHEYPLLGSESTKNNSTYNYTLLRSVTLFSLLFSSVSRKRSAHRD